MSRWLVVLFCCVLTACVAITSVEARRPELKALDPSGRLPADLVDPEDKPAWEIWAADPLQVPGGAALLAGTGALNALHLNVTGSPGRNCDTYS